MRTFVPFLNTRGFANDIFDEMDKLFADTGRKVPALAYDERPFLPACDVSETDQHFLMSFDLPGMKKEEIKIELNENVLTVSGERKRDVKDEEGGRFQRFEKSYGSFKRSFTLPPTVEGEKVEANYTDGVLELYLPKTPLAKPRQVEIQTGKTGFFNRLLESKN